MSVELIETFCKASRTLLDQVPMKVQLARNSCCELSGNKSMNFSKVSIQLTESVYKVFRKLLDQVPMQLQLASDSCCELSRKIKKCL